MSASMVMKDGRVARPDNMSVSNDAGGPRNQGRASLLVAPGEDLGESEGHEAGHGVLEMDGRLRATKHGRVNDNGTEIAIEPLRTAYIPHRVIWSSDTWRDAPTISGSSTLEPHLTQYYL